MNRLSIALIFMSLFFVSSVVADTITIRADVWCPYNCEPGAEAPGYMIEIAQQIFGTLNHTVDYQSMPWARALKQTRSGKYVAVVGAYVEDAPDFTFADFMGTSTMIFYGRKGDKWKFDGIKSLKTIKLGVVRDYAYTTELDKYIADNSKGNKVQLASGEEAIEINIKKLKKKRIDIFIANDKVLAYHIKRTGRLIDDFQNCGLLSTDKVHMAFSPKNPKSTFYAETVNQGMKNLRKSGDLKKILEKYNVQDWIK
ncbi:ABC transporter, periplasmic domain protein [Candidatus Magnetomorum sp. HK-1]|nr:ABC transporter, periplasmic domain protein [Candidatus Magnetomorum sp. HK-1]